MSSASKKQGTRVFKKGSPNGKITVYLGKRDFVDHVTHVDPIDGVVLVDPDYLKDRKVYGHVLAAFRYGREDLDVLGLTFRKDLYLASSQIFPVPEDSETTKRPLTRLQERLVKKLGANAYPFFFELPPHCPASVTLQPAPGDTGGCGTQQCSHKTCNSQLAGNLVDCFTFYMTIIEDLMLNVNIFTL